MADVTAQYANNIETVVTNNPLTAVETAINVLNGSIFPTLGAGEYFYATLYQEENPVTEVVKITAVNSNTLTAVRGQDNTTAREWLAPTSLGMRANAAVFEELRDKANNPEPPWGTIIGTLANQIDLQNALDAKADAWGTITGTLANQTDLQNALNAKADTTDLADYLSLDGTSAMTGAIDTTTGTFTSSVTPSATVPAYSFASDSVIKGTTNQYGALVDSAGNGLSITSGGGNLVIEYEGSTGSFDSLNFGIQSALGVISFSSSGGGNSLGINPGINAITTNHPTELNLSAANGATSIGKFTATSWQSLSTNTVDIGTATIKMKDGYFQGGVDAADFNGVALTTGGAGTQYLADDGTYKTPAGGGDTLAAADEAITGLWDFQNVGGLVTDVIDESTLNAGVTIEGLLLKDNTLSYSGSTENVINISNDTGLSGQATAIIATTASSGQGLRATANGLGNVAGVFSNSSGTHNSTISLGKGGANMATFSYFTSNVNINTSGGITSTKGIDKLTHASGSVDVAAATAPSAGQVLTATSGTAATWQTPAVSQVVYAGGIFGAGVVISMANGQTGWSVSRTTAGEYLVTHPLGTNNLTITITSYTLNTTVAHNTPSSTNFTIFIRSVSTLGGVDAAVDFMVINKD